MQLQSIFPPLAYDGAVVRLLVIYACFTWVLFLWRRYHNWKSGFSDWLTSVGCLGDGEPPAPLGEPGTQCSPHRVPASPHAYAELKDTDLERAPTASTDLGTPDPTARCSSIDSWASTSTARVGTLRQYTLFVLTGFGMRSPLQSQRFPHYEYLRTGQFAAILLLLMSSSALDPHDAREVRDLSRQMDQCRGEHRLAKLEVLRRRFEESTRLVQARKQGWNLGNFTDALHHDQKLYGSPNHECPRVVAGVPGDLSGWSEQYASTRFFSNQGWCNEVLKQSIDREQGKLCQKRMKFPKVPDCRTVKKCAPSWAGDWGVNCVSARACTPQVERVVNEPCGDDEGAAELFRQYTQYQEGAFDRGMRRKTLEERRIRHDTAQSLPSSSSYSELLLEAADGLMDRLLIGIDLFSYYRLLALLFPSPLLLFFEPLTMRFRRSLWYMRKEHFLFGFLALWYLKDSAQLVMLDPRFRVYMEFLSLLPSVARPDVCLMDRGFLKQAMSYIYDRCDELSQMEHSYRHAMAMVQLDLDDVRNFSMGPPCDCRFPTDRLRSLGCPDDYQKEISHWTRPESAPGWCAPKPDTPWYGNSSLCGNDHAMLKLLLAHTELLDFGHALASAGLALRFLASALASDLLINLVKLVDPLCFSGGEYTAPNVHHHTLSIDREKFQLVLEMLRAEAMVHVLLDSGLLLFSAYSTHEAYRELGSPGVYGAASADISIPVCLPLALLSSGLSYFYFRLPRQEAAPARCEERGEFDQEERVELGQPAAPTLREERGELDREAAQALCEERGELGQQAAPTLREERGEIDQEAAQAPQAAGASPEREDPGQDAAAAAEWHEPPDADASSALLAAVPGDAPEAAEQQQQPPAAAAEAGPPEATGLRWAWERLASFAKSLARGMRALVPAWRTEADS